MRGIRRGAEQKNAGHGGHRTTVWVLVLCLVATSWGALKAADAVKVTGNVTDPQGAAVAGAVLTLTNSAGTTWQAPTGGQGDFLFEAVTPGEYTLTAAAAGFAPVKRRVSVASQPIILDVRFVQLAGQKSVVIVSSTLEPSIDRRNSDVYGKTLFERDDQLLETLDAGINAGQHEGGGKSLEIRRFGFNLDHGGVNGGLKVVVNDLPQNQASQGHGQGYLGSLKALTPELVQ